MNIALVRPDGTGLRMLTTDLRERNFMPNWSPDGSQITFYLSRNSEKYELWTVRADGSGLQQLTKTPHGIAHLASSPNSSAIAVRGGVDVYIFDPTAISEGERLRKLSRRKGVFEATSWSPDGRWLAGMHFDWNDKASPPSPEPKIALLALYSEDYRVLTEGTFPKWLSDGRRLLFQKADGIYLLDSKSDKYQRVLPVSSWFGRHVPGYRSLPRWPHDLLHRANDGERYLDAHAPRGAVGFTRGEWLRAPGHRQLFATILLPVDSHCRRFRRI